MINSVLEFTDNKLQNNASSTLMGSADIRSTTDYVINTLRRAILTHQLEAGTRLVEAKTSKELNVSITPVRGAFSVLANQGLLTVFPYKGTYVTVLSKEEVEDIFCIRINLEKMSAERAFKVLTDKDVQNFEEICRLSDVAAQNSNLYDAINYDILFHEKLFVLCGSTLMMQMWNTIKFRIENIQSYTKIVMRETMVTRHSKLLEALRNKDVKLYIKSLEDHIKSSKHGIEFPEEKTIVYK